MRREPTIVENKLWRLLRARNLGGWKFRRQEPLEGFIVDFVCFEAKLVVEADGGQHDASETDRERDRILRKAGFAVVRYWNNDILNNPDGVLEDLARRLKVPSPPAGEGGRSRRRRSDEGSGSG